MPDKLQGKRVQLPIEWVVPEDIITRYANNITIQRGENEYYLSFFETKPPMFLGTPEQINEQLEKAGAVKSICVARIVLPIDKMKAFVEAMEKSSSLDIPDEIEDGSE
jgi:hypothetical protein